MAPHVHRFFPRENKVNKLSKWLIAWIVFSLQNGKVQPYDLLPSKAEFASHIGVSLGTMQNVFRFVEDAGYIESKQKVGTYIKDRKASDVAKLTSKKDYAIDSIKQYMRENGYKQGDVLISTRKLAQILKISNTTVRVAIMSLVLQGVLEKKKRSFVLTGRSYKVNDVHARTLVEKLAEKLKKHIKKEFKSGDKLPSSNVLAKKFKVSSKTIHDAVKQLAKDGVLYTRRGRYGTIVLDANEQAQLKMYDYEKIEHKIRTEIASKYNVGDKLPTIKDLASVYKTSEKTIKKALDNLADDGFLMFMRGRYGGTFVTDIPSANDAYQWLAINPDYVPNSDN